MVRRGVEVPMLRCRRGLALAAIVLAGLLPACTSAEAPEDPAVMIHLYSGVENPVITVDHRTYEDALACLREAGPGDPAAAMGGDGVGFGSFVLEDGAVSYYLGETWATESGGEALTALDGCTEWFAPFHEAATEQLPADVLAHLEETREQS
ncbi:hypothetical protein [Brachybacterium phenoliresistens]|uniref:hypothetical protein n=1 Tax=Brachybacterium phenoliresistens TaxID=396014 RepID=UPI0031D1C19C